MFWDPAGFWWGWIFTTIRKQNITTTTFFQKTNSFWTIQRWPFQIYNEDNSFWDTWFHALPLCVEIFHPISVIHKNCRSSGGGGNVRVPDTMGLTCDSYTIRFCPAARQDHVKSSVCPSSKNKRKRSVLLSFRCHFVFALVGGTLSWDRHSAATIRTMFCLVDWSMS